MPKSVAEEYFEVQTEVEAEKETNIEIDKVDEVVATVLTNLQQEVVNVEDEAESEEIVLVKVTPEPA